MSASRWFRIIGLIVVVSMLATLVGSAFAAAPEKPAVVVALDSDIDHIEPMEFRTDAGYYATANLYEPMLAQKLKPDADGVILEGQNEYGPNLAESFTVSPDGKLVTLKIRQGAKFANGDEITAESFKHTFDRAMTAKRSYIGLLTQFMGISKADEVVVKDKYTLEMHAEQAAALMVPQLSFQVFGAMDPATTKANAVQPDAAKKIEGDEWAFDWYRKNANPSGPYQLTQWQSGQQYVFEPNPNYWQGADFFKNSKVIVKVVQSPEDRELLLKKGDIDLALGLPFKDITALKADPNVQVKAIKYNRLFYLGMNNKIKPFDNVKVRQAISYGIPYKTIIDKVFYGYAQPATSPIPDGMPTHNASFWKYDTDTAKTAAMLKDAGVSNLKLELSVRQSIPWDVDSAVWIQSSLSEAGVEVTVNKMTDADYFDKLNKHQLQFFIHDWYSWGNDPAYQLTFLLKSAAFTNYADYSNPRVDELIQKVTWTTDPAERQKMMDEAQKIIVEEAPWAFLEQPNWIVAMNKNFTGFAKVDDLCLRFAYMGKK
jgi:peptide/nickel transport system substrate-binding protein